MGRKNLKLKNLSEELQKKDDIIDILVVGGGIVGVGLLRDLSLHLDGSNKTIVMLERGDFCSQTSSRSSKMLHGGIRYLETLDFHLVHEALEEKNIWAKLAPHLCYEKPFLLPIFKTSKYSLPELKIGLFLYDFLSNFKNSPHQILNKKEALQFAPQLRPEDLRGAGIYHDVIMDDMKIGLECLYDALVAPNVHAYNYHQVEQCRKISSYYLVEVKDLITGEKLEIKAREVSFATGPFTDQLFKELQIPDWRPHMAPSKGIHLWLAHKALQLEGPLLLMNKDNRVIFVIPQFNGILVGTTETQTEQNFFNIQATSEEINYLLNTLNNFFPQAKLEAKHILSSFAGIRPLVLDRPREHSLSAQTLGKISREHRLFHLDSNLHLLVGGKYTTFRRMVQDLTRHLVLKRNIPYNDQKTLNSLRRLSTVSPFTSIDINEAQIDSIVKTELPRTTKDIMRRLGIHSEKNWLDGRNQAGNFEALRELVIKKATKSGLLNDF